MYLKLENVSSTKKLFILREAIDMLKQGIQPDMNVIDACYEDLDKCLADYEIMLEEIDECSSGLETDDIQVSNNSSIVSSAKKQYGDSYEELILQLQKLSERERHNYICYITEDIKDKSKLNLRVWDDTELCYVRTYEDKVDLDLNLKQDIKYNFKKQKISVSNIGNNVKKLSKDPKENHDAEFGNKGDNNGLDEEM